MSQHGYMRHMATPPLVLEIGQKLCSEAYNLTTSAAIRHVLSTLNTAEVRYFSAGNRQKTHF